MLVWASAAGIFSTLAKLGQFNWSALMLNEASCKLLRSQTAPTSAQGFHIYGNKWAIIVKPPVRGDNREPFSCRKEWRLLWQHIWAHKCKFSLCRKNAPHWQLLHCWLFFMFHVSCLGCLSWRWGYSDLLQMKSRTLSVLTGPAVCLWGRITVLSTLDCGTSAFRTQKIFFADIAKMLMLDSENPVVDAESMLRPRGHWYTIDHANSWTLGRSLRLVVSTRQKDKWTR